MQVVGFQFKENFKMFKCTMKIWNKALNTRLFEKFTRLTKIKLQYYVDSLAISMI